MNEQERKIILTAESLMARIREREDTHDSVIEELRININKMLQNLSGTLVEKCFFASSLAHRLSRSQEEFNLMYRRFIDTICGDIEKSIADIKSAY
jgi:hypothetical protein